MPTAASPAAADPRSAARSRPLGAGVPALPAILLGRLIIGTAGFSHLDAVHEAAHDSRHSNAFGH